MSLHLYNTLTRKKELFPKKPGEKVTIYLCGPTVYKPSHIGHMVGPVIFDALKRYLTYWGFEVTWVVNITDVDDKLIERAQELGSTVKDLAEKMTADYKDCLVALGVDAIDHFPKATDHIPSMIEMIDTLISKGYAYVSGSDVYFDVSRDPDYGKLCNRDPEQMEAGSRIEVTSRKKNAGDFALWKGAKPHEPAEVQFTSPWGKGRPGWHIECSAMSQKLLGETLDIHGGGLDLQFPHHENELAQSESATDQPFARFWLHNGLLKLKNKEGKEDKMSGSLGNVLNVDVALKHLSGEVVRFFILNTHYRSPIDLGIWDWHNPDQPIPEGMLASKRSFDTFIRFTERFARICQRSFSDLEVPARYQPERSWQAPEHREYYERFLELMNDDFNTGGACGVLFEIVSAANRFAEQHHLEDEVQRTEARLAEFLEAAQLLKELAGILGLSLTPAPQAWANDQLVHDLMALIVELRNNIRGLAKGAEKSNPLRTNLFEQTDLIRQRLSDLKIILEDRAQQTSWRIE